MPTGGWHPAFLLPGLWLAALTVALAWVLRRWLDPVPARCWAVWWIPVLALFWRALLGGAVLLPLGILTRWAPFRSLWPEGAPRPGNPLQVDLVLQIHPWLARARAALLAGEWPLWNGLAGVGEPLLGNPQSQSVQPIALAALPLELAQAPAAMAGLRVLLACAFTYLLLRRQTIGEGPALAASLCWGLGGGVQLWLGWPIANTACLLPAVLYALVASEERGGRAAQALLAAALFALLVGGHPETILHALLAVAAFAVSRLRRRELRAGRATAARWAVAAAVAVAAAAPALVPAAAVLRDSVRAEQVERGRARRAATAEAAAARDERRGESRAATGAETPARRGEVRAAALRLAPIVAPAAFGNSRYGAYWGHRNSNFDGSAFAGSAALLAALAALGPRRRRLPQERLMLGVAAVALVVAARPPGLGRLLAAAPLLRESPQLHYRVLLLLGFAVTYLAACTWERWRRDGLPVRPAAAGAALAAAAVGTVYLLFAPPSPGALAGWRGLAFGAQVAGLAAAPLLAALGGWRRPLAAAGFVAILATELALLHGPANPSSPRRLHYPATPALRIAAARLAPGERVAATEGALRPNAASVLGLADVRSNNPSRPAAVARALAAARQPGLGPRELLAAPLHPLHDLMAVRLLLVAQGESLPPPLRRVHTGADAWVYERPRWLGPLFLPAATSPCPDAAWRRCLQDIRDFAAHAAVRPGPGGAAGPGARWRAAQPASSTVRLLSHEGARLSAGLRLAEPRLVASSLYQDGGWLALVDRRPMPTFEANGPFAAVTVRPPATRLDLIYRPPGFLAAALLAALGLATGLTLWTPPPLKALAISSRP